MKNTDNTAAIPFLRWAGGKSWLIRYWDSIIGNQVFQSYHEPFLGGGAIFFSLNFKGKAFISDINEELICTYQAVKDNHESVITKMQAFENTPECYYRIRGTKPKTPIETAARFIYLNQTSYNGLYRVNIKGEYNVPFGYRNKSFLNDTAIRNASFALKPATVFQGDFARVIENVNAGDLVFLDPPYTVSHNKNAFIKYNQKLFSLEDQYRLKNLIESIKRLGAYYILTNAAHEKIYEIFYDEDDRCLMLDRASLIGGENAKRGQVSEYVFTNLRGPET